MRAALAEGVAAGGYGDGYAEADFGNYPKVRIGSPGCLAVAACGPEAGGSSVGSRILGDDDPAEHADLHVIEQMAVEGPLAERIGRHLEG